MGLVTIPNKPCPIPVGRPHSPRSRVCFTGEVMSPLMPSHNPKNELTSVVPSLLLALSSHSLLLSFFSLSLPRYSPEVSLSPPRLIRRSSFPPLIHALLTTCKTRLPSFQSEGLPTPLRFPSPSPHPCTLLTTCKTRHPSF
jgi:hypothetical protein